MKVRHSARTDVGKTRDHNEDNFGAGEGPQLDQLGRLFVVCDGMGGHAAGEVASQLAVAQIIAAYYEDSNTDRVAALRDAFVQANNRIHAEWQGRTSMGTTGVAVLLVQNSFYFANVGDSRGYLLRNGQIRQVTNDHSLVGEQVAAGVITAEQARNIYYRNVITRALGYQQDVEIDLFHVPARPGDIAILSSDGLHGLVEDDEIARIVGTAALEDAVDQLVDLANERGGSDNITVLLVQVDAVDPNEATTDSEEAPHDRITTEMPAVQLPPSPESNDLPLPLATTGLLASASTPIKPRLPQVTGILAAVIIFVAVLFIALVLLQPTALPFSAAPLEPVPAGTSEPTRLPQP